MTSLLPHGLLENHTERGYVEHSSVTVPKAQEIVLLKEGSFSDTLLAVWYKQVYVKIRNC